LEVGDDLGAKDCTEPVAIVDVIVIEVGAGVVPGYPRVIVVVLLGKPLVSVRVIHLCCISGADPDQNPVRQPDRCIHIPSRVWGTTVISKVARFHRAMPYEIPASHVVEFTLFAHYMACPL